MKQKLADLKEEIYRYTVTVWDFNITFSIQGRSRENINKEIEDLKNTINLLDLTDYIENTLPSHSKSHILLK